MAYDLHFDRFVEPARAKSSLWRLGFGVVLMMLIYGLVAVTIVLAVGFGFGLKHVEALASGDGFGDPWTLLWTLLWVLSTFLGMALAPLIVVRLLHKRKAATLLGRGPRVLRDFVKTAGVYFAIGLPLTGLWVVFGDLSVNLSPAIWLSFLSLTIVAILVQTLAEELVFRGYLLQQLGARFRSPLVWMVLPSLTFAFLHYDPSFGFGTLVSVVAVTAIFGIVAADLTALTGSLGAAWGFHFANNFMAITLVSVDGRLSGLALYRGAADLAGAGLPPLAIIGDIVMIAVGWFIVRRVVSR